MDYLKEVEGRGLNAFQMMEVKEGLKTLTTDQVDVYANPEYDHMQMQEIRLALEHGLTEKEMSVFLDPGIDYQAMNHARIKIQNANVIDKQAVTKLRSKQLKNVFVFLLIITILFIVSAGGYFGKKYYDLFNQPMEIKLKSNQITLKYGEAFNPISYLDDYTKADGIELILPEGINTNQIGEVKVIYTLKNQLKSVSKELLITIQDKTAPTITLNTKDVTLTRTKDTFNAKAYLSNAKDDVDGDVTEAVTWTKADESVNDQTITYSVKDSAGNESQSVLNLHYKDPEPASEPETIIIYQPIGGGGDTSGGVSPPTNTSHGTQNFMFSDGYNLDSGYSACVAAGSSYGAYSCEPIMGSDGLYKGYKLTY